MNAITGSLLLRGVQLADIDALPMNLAREMVEAARRTDRTVWLFLGGAQDEDAFMSPEEALSRFETEARHG